MKENPTDQPTAFAQTFGTLLLVGGLLLAGGIILNGIESARAAQPDMLHVNHVGATVCGGPLAVWFIIFGFYIRRRGF
ncbi:hypothetical protein [Fimbriiglobus ruber]|uniref:Uncharacterized protein n=1 Tax=Fimbriiglobus ruber TaxID=1908690 RepID=A0A225E0R7_9BACT|nr:hypothetical protein [Fimbriiglobus ruber]OWK45394.1 hypothetical protein FRUB_01725 [Fimbriiglobus ruber]